jgi:hypothetical protein
MTKPIQIRNEEVVRDIREAAALTHQTITDVVAEGVRAVLVRARQQASPETRRRRVDAIVADFQAAVRVHGGPMITDDDLYDENGLPR